MSKDLKQTVKKLLDFAGVTLNGPHPWDPQVKNPRFYARLLSGGSLALGESYMDEWWECAKLDEFFARILRAELDEKVKGALVWPIIKSKILNMQTVSKSYEVGKKHYDIGNDLYQKMLGKRMIYSCGYWKQASTLDKAQEAKLDLICKKMGLKPGMRILDIGCGWGGFLKYAAEKYKIKGVGITISKEQATMAKKSCTGLPIEIRMQDYRSLNDKFDCIISIGMFEHVGPKNYQTFMGVVNKNLKEDGLFLLHTIGSNKSHSAQDPFILKYIFPNSKIPSLDEIMVSINKLFIMEDFHSFGQDYDTTLMAWHHNFIKSWKGLQGRYGERFYRMWRYYLLSCAGSFRARNVQLWQMVLSKQGIVGGYSSFR